MDPMRSKSSSTTPPEGKVTTVTLEEDVYELLGKMAAANYRSRKQEMKVIILEAARQRGYLADEKEHQHQSSVILRGAGEKRQKIAAEARSKH